MARLSDAVMELPQDYKHHGRFNDPRTFGTIFRTCLEGVDASAAIVAILDGADPDSGTCFEVGYAYARGIPVIGVRIGYPHNQENGLNLMLSRGCTAVVFRPAFDEDFDALAQDVARKIKRVVADSAGTGR